jgi:hypothetical protein
MAKKGGLGRGLSDIMASEPSGPTFHPVISPVAFAAVAEKRGATGATMDIGTGQILDTDNPKKDTYVVGKEPDSKGVPIPTTESDFLNPSKMGQGGHSEFLGKVLSKINEIKQATGGRTNVGIGAWHSDDLTSTDLDAVSPEPDLAKAMEKARVRNEKAIFSTKKYRESGNEDGDILNPSYKER